MKEPAIGHAELTVAHEHTAAHLIEHSTDNFTAVFATMQMIGLMELAASRAMHALLQPGEVSVGVTIDIAHAAPTSIGDKVRAAAEFKEMDGKLYVFKISAADSAGEIGRGLHKRAIVTKERLENGAAKRRRN